MVFKLGSTVEPLELEPELDAELEPDREVVDPRLLFDEPLPVLLESYILI